MLKEQQYRGKTYNQWVNAYNKGQASYGDYLIARKILVEERHTVVIDGSDITLPGTVDGIDLSAHAADPAAHHTPGLGEADIIDLIIYLTGAVNRMIAPPVLQIPEPSISVAVAEDHSGGGHPVDKTLTIPVPSISVTAELV